jgi:hypothetical protein
MATPSEHYQEPEVLAHSFRNVLAELGTFDLNDRPSDISVRDWPLRVSAYRRQAYLLAEAEAAGGVLSGGVLSSAKKEELLGKYFAAVSVLKWGAHPVEKTTSALAEMAAMAVLFNDEQYLDFLHRHVCSLSEIPIAARRQLEKKVGVEVVYRALKWNAPNAKAALSRLRKDGLRAPKLFLDFPAGAVVKDRWYWDDGVAMAIIEERWRTAANPHGYLRTTARFIICAQIINDESERVKALEAGVRLSSPDWPDGRPKEVGLEPENTSLSFDRNKAFDMAGFDADMIAFVDAKVAGISRAAMPAYLSERTGSPWDSKRVENARGRVRSHARKFLAVVNEIGEFGVPRGTGPEAGLVGIGKNKYGPSVIRREDGQPAKAAPARKCHSSLVVSWSSQTFYRQRFHPTPHWTFAHLFADGRGVMDDGLETLREILVAERKALMAEFPPDAEQHGTDATMPASSVMVARRLLPMCDVSRPTGFGRVFD